jgi:hypothetical protein
MDQAEHDAVDIVRTCSSEDSFVLARVDIFSSGPFGWLEGEQAL